MKFISEFASKMQNAIMAKLIIDELVLMITGAEFAQHLANAAIFAGLYIVIQLLTGVLGSAATQLESVHQEWFSEYVDIQLADRTMKMDFEHTEDPEALDALEKAQEGIIADFDGIISGIKTAVGSRVEKGSELFTIQSSSAVQVTVELSKYDLEKVKEGQSATVTVAGVSYSGTVSRINRVAQNNAQNTPVVYADVMIENPDGNIFLGIEGKAEILTGSAEGVVLVPYEAVNTDKEGDFCYLVKDGVIVRQNVVTGISSDTDVEIKEGISEGDTVVISSDMDLMEGLQVNPVMQ